MCRQSADRSVRRIVRADHLPGSFFNRCVDRASVRGRGRRSRVAGIWTQPGAIIASGSVRFFSVFSRLRDGCTFEFWCIEIALVSPPADASSGCSIKIAASVTNNRCRLDLQSAPVLSHAVSLGTTIAPNRGPIIAGDPLDPL